MDVHIAALFTSGPSNDLVRVNEPAGGVAPRFFLGMTADGPLLRFRGDVDQATRKELAQAAAQVESGPGASRRPLDAGPFQAILARSAPIERTWLGPAFLCSDEFSSGLAATRIGEHNADLLRDLIHGWMVDVPLSQPMMALVVEDRAVAVCCSVRRTDAAHEADVETAAALRGRGYAALVVSARARAVREAQRLPLYSTSWYNAASQSVARKLALVLFGSDLHIT